MLRCSFGLTPLPQGGSGDRFLPLRLKACVDPQGSQGDLDSSAEDAVHLAFRHFLPFLEGKYVLVQSDNSPTVYQINYQGATKSSQSLWEAQGFQWAWQCLASLRTMHLPDVQNKAADMLSHKKPPLGERRLNSVVVQMTWKR